MRYQINDISFIPCPVNLFSLIFFFPIINNYVIYKMARCVLPSFIEGRKKKKKISNLFFKTLSKQKITLISPCLNT